MNYTLNTYSWIIQHIVGTEDNAFSYSIKHTRIDNIIKILFATIMSNKLTVKDKFVFFTKSLDNFYIRNYNKTNEFIEHFCKVQRTYHILNRLIYNYKYKKATIVVTTDMCMNELNINDKNVICIFHNNSKYLFHLNDLIKIINTNLTNAPQFFADPKCVLNPYDNIAFKKSNLYNIYFHMKYKTTYSDELFQRFFKDNFNLTLFKNNNEYLLREYSIYNYVYKSPANLLVKEINSMLLYFNKYCKECLIQGKIIIDKDFPKQKLVKIMQPYLLLFFKSYYSLFKKTRDESLDMLHKYLLRFNYYNPQFGRKKYKIIIQTNSNYKKRVSSKIVEFDDKHIEFNNIKIQNNNFLSDHLHYEELDEFCNRNIFIQPNNLQMIHMEEQSEILQENTSGNNVSEQSYDEDDNDNMSDGNIFFEEEQQYYHEDDYDEDVYDNHEVDEYEDHEHEDDYEEDEEDSIS